MYTSYFSAFSSNNFSSITSFSSFSLIHFYFFIIKHILHEFSLETRMCRFCLFKVAPLKVVTQKKVESRTIIAYNHMTNIILIGNARYQKLSGSTRSTLYFFFVYLKLIIFISHHYVKIKL